MKKFTYGVLWFLLDMVIVVFFIIVARAMTLLVDPSWVHGFGIYFISGWFCHAAISYIERKRKVRTLFIKIKDKFPIVEDIKIKEE